MRKFLTLLVIFLISSLTLFNTINATEIKTLNTTINDSVDNDTIQMEYPKIINKNNETYVIFTLEQAKNIDTKLEILEILEEIHITSENFDSVYIKVIDDKNTVIEKQSIQIENLNSKIENKNKQIENLKKQISIYENVEDNYQNKLGNKEKQIELHKERIKQLNRKITIGGITSGVVIIGGALLILSTL